MNAAVPDKGDSSRELLEQLLEEISTLAIRLRHPGAGLGQAQELPAAVQSVLSILDRQGPLSVPAIARVKSTSRQNVQIIVNRLKNAGIVELSSNPAHKTSELVSISETGQARLAKAEDVLGRSLEALAKQFTADELQSCFNSIQKLRRALSAAKLDAESSARGKPLSTERPSGPTPSAAHASPSEESQQDQLPVNLL